jgi:glutamine synthetase
MSLTPRQHAVQTAISRTIRRIPALENRPAISSYFGSSVFGLDQLREKLAKDSYDSLMNMVNKGSRLPKAVADEIANVIKDWAITQGATYFCHWFQPMTGLTAEKHDAFITTKTSETGQTNVLERFTGAALIQSEPDASSFPSGGMRSTFEARGYTAWDPTSPLFIIESANGRTLCIPSAFMGYHGQALDTKTPLLRSVDYLSQQAVRFLKLIGDVDVTQVSATLGVEQEYFLVDRALYSLRPDLVMTGRTLIGRASTRGQQFEDHYFGSIPSRVLAFMHELEYELYRLGIPVKTRHNEVAPGQFEIAPVFEDANLAADHNSLMMDILTRVALRHDFVCLLHEKPFAGINGSGKHNNWSIATQKGENLLEPGKTPHQSLRFLAVLAAVLKAVHDRGAALRIGIASAGNDHRLGANEAPPAIISVFVGEMLSKILDQVEVGKVFEGSTEEGILSLGVSKIPAISRDNTDRNRTSPFAFTGNKFEFRAVGGSANCAFPMTFLNTAVGEAFGVMADRLEKKLGKSGSRDEAVIELIREVVGETKKIRFEGNGYSEEWKKEAQKRGLPNLRTTPEALAVFDQPSEVNFLSAAKVLQEAEVKARHVIMLERYCKQIEMEASTVLDLLATAVLPSCEKELSHLATMVAQLKAAGQSGFESRLKELGQEYQKLLTERERLEKALEKAHGLHDEGKRSVFLSETVMSVMEAIRDGADRVEGMVSDENWSLPKYREMLFLR